MEEKKSDKISLEVMLNRVIFQQDTFQIISFTVTDLNSDLRGTNITVKGTAPTVEYGMTYKIIVKEVIDKKYGKQYELISIRTDYDMSDGNQVKKFFSFFLTGRQIDSLFQNLEDPVEVLENKDVEKLCTIKGIKQYTARKIIEAYFLNKDNSEAYIKLHDFGLTKNAIDRLVNAYGTPEMAIEKVTTNPYILIEEVKNYGWKKADAIALNSGIGPTSQFRLCAFTKYYLDKCANEDGDTWIDLQELRNAFADEIPEANDEQIRECLKTLTSTFVQNKASVKYFPVSNRICLTKHYELEQEICNELKRIKSGKNLEYNKNAFDFVKKEIEAVQGWTFEEEQIQATKLALDNQVSVITGPAGCVDCDSEFFNGKEWKKISKWTPEDKVLQYNDDGTTNLVTPERYIRFTVYYI